MTFQLNIRTAEDRLEDHRARRANAIRAAYSAAMSGLADAYPAHEREGWPEQVIAARAVLAGGSSELIDAMIAHTGETAQECAEAILAKRADHAVRYGALTGLKRSLLAQLAAAKTPAQIDAVHWPDDP